MAKQVKLKPCPFCGGKAILTDSYYAGGALKDSRLWDIKCQTFGCGATIEDFIFAKEAIAAWNKRSTRRART